MESQGELGAESGTIEPATVETLRRDPLALGVEPWDALLEHASLRALGWVRGGSLAVIQAPRHTLCGGSRTRHRSGYPCSSRG